MSTVPIAAVVLLVLAALCGGWLAGHGSGAHKCVICYRPLSRVCDNGRCGQVSKSPRISDPLQFDRAMAKLIGPRPPRDPQRAEWDQALELMTSLTVKKETKR